jgi:hypothetical protein
MAITTQPALTVTWGYLFLLRSRFEVRAPRAREGIAIETRFG